LQGAWGDGNTRGRCRWSGVLCVGRARVAGTGTELRWVADITIGGGAAWGGADWGEGISRADGMEPSQYSATSQPPVTAGRHTALLAKNLSAGQAAEEPVQYSATSQAPAVGRQTSVAATNLSRGQAVLTPSQVSETSHTSVANRHTVPAGAGLPL